MGAHSRRRDRYFDVLRAVALVRVVAYHTFGWAWAGLVFPSMGVMFGLAGTLMARSLALAALAYGGWYALAHQAEYGTYDLDENPLAQAFWSAGFVTLLLYARVPSRSTSGTRSRSSSPYR
ncbi:hypothetical protein SUDANB51_04784 [Streptomyces sp. enrichment culture]